MKLKIGIVILFVLLAFALRIYKVTEIPTSLNWDEVSIGYNAFSILETGKDEWSRLFPVHFEAYGEYKLPMQIYLSIPAIFFFGLDDFGIRITPVIYGSLTVAVVFFLAEAIFGSLLAASFAAFLLAFSPWHIQLTRASFESSLATFFISIGMWLLVKGFRKPSWFIFSMIPFALSIFTYNSARIFTPMFLFVTLFLYRRNIFLHKKIVIYCLILFFILMLPIIPFILSSNKNARYKLVSVTDDPGLVQRVNQGRGHSILPEPFSAFAHNKVTYTTLAVISNYLAHLSPQFLFVSGAPHKQHHVQDMGELYLFQAPFLLLGLIGLFVTKNKYKNLLLSWLLLGLVPVSVTNDSIPHALRTLIVLPFFQIISGFGLFLGFEYFRKANFIYKGLLYFSLFFLVTINIYNYLISFYQVYPYRYSKDWQYGYKQVVGYIKDHEKEYDLVVFSRTYGEPHMFTLFYLNYDPAKFQNSPNLVRYETSNWVWVLKFDKFYFPDLGDADTRYENIVSQNKNKKILFVGKQGDFPENIRRLLVVNFLDGNEAFEIVEKDEN